MSGIICLPGARCAHLPIWSSSPPAAWGKRLTIAAQGIAHVMVPSVATIKLNEETNLETVQKLIKVDAVVDGGLGKASA